MRKENDIVVHVEHLNKNFYSIRGYWRQKKHPVQAVKDISFSICKGKLFGMVGPNGAGKTTPVPILFIAIFTTYQAIVNTVRALSDKPVRYPLSIPFIK